MANADTGQRCHESTDLLWAPFFTKSAGYRRDQAGQALRPLAGGTSSVIATSLSLFGIIATGRRVAAQLTANRAAVEPQFPSDLSLAPAQVMAGVNLVSLCLGQLLVSHALLHFGR